MSDPLCVRLHGVGPVGLSFALWAKRLLGTRIRIDLADANLNEPPAAALLARPLAISQGSRQLLERVIAFPTDCAPIDQVDIAMAGHLGRMRLTAAELALPRLGNVVRYADLWRALRAAWQALPADQDDRFGGDAIGLTVHAEGSRKRAVAPLAAQVALLADLSAERPAKHVAFERFQSDGPLALLPLARAEPADYTLVWCADRAKAEARHALAKADFDAELNRAFGAQLGRLAVIGERSLAPLHQDRRTALIGEQEVWIGNAAQTLHPVAGQGLNLGLRDAYELAMRLARADQLREPLAVSLAGYEKVRRADRLSMQAVTSALASDLRAPLLRPLQGLVLGAADLTPPLRARLARGFVHGWPRS